MIFRTHHRCVSAAFAPDRRLDVPTFADTTSYKV
jgi:hypothetical protein